MKNSKRIISIVAIIAIALTMAFGAFSYFTDYATATVESKAGTLDILLTEDIDLDDDIDILNPGDTAPVDFTVTNEGEKSADIMTVITVWATDAGGNELDMTDANLDGVADDPDVIDDHVYRIIGANGDELAYTVEGNKVIYTIGGDGNANNGAVTLNGTIEEEDGVAVTSYTYEYDFEMDADALNAWQATNVHVKVEVFAKQHRNTDAGWNLIDTFEVSDTVNGNE